MVSTQFSSSSSFFTFSISPRPVCLRPGREEKCIFIGKADFLVIEDIEDQVAMESKPKLKVGLTKLCY